MNFKIIIACYGGVQRILYKKKGGTEVVHIIEDSTTISILEFATKVIQAK